MPCCNYDRDAVYFDTIQQVVQALGKIGHTLADKVRYDLSTPLAEEDVAPRVQEMRAIQERVSAVFGLGDPPTSTTAPAPVDASTSTSAPTPASAPVELSPVPDSTPAPEPEPAAQEAAPKRRGRPAKAKPSGEAPVPTPTPPPKTGDTTPVWPAPALVATAPTPTPAPALVATTSVDADEDDEEDEVSPGDNVVPFPALEVLEPSNLCHLGMERESALDVLERMEQSLSGNEPTSHDMALVLAKYLSAFPEADRPVYFKGLLNDLKLAKYSDIPPSRRREVLDYLTTRINTKSA